MSAAESVLEKAKDLNEEEAHAVLKYIARLRRPRRWTAQELMLLDRSDRERILKAQMAEAGALYRDHPDLIVDVVDEPLDYE